MTRSSDPGLDEEIFIEEYQEAYRLASGVVTWVEEQLALSKK